MILKDIKMVFIDLDGTSLDSRKKMLSPQNIKAIKKYEERGIKVIISTGRSLNPTTLKITSQISETRDIIAWNGAKVVKNFVEVFSASIDPQIINDIASLMQKHKINAIVNSDFKKQTYTDCLFISCAIKFKKGTVNKISDFNPQEPVYKIIFWSRNKKKYILFKQELILKFSNQLNIVSSRHNHSEILEVTDIKASKGDGNLLFAKLCNINSDNCIHIGDTMNDSTTIGKMKYVIAMKNATNNFKKVATHVSPFSYKRGGLAKTLKHFLG
ncbi:hypothetical protein MCAL160_0961 [Mycoplasmopsis californica HAZ160_1]|uniref:COF family HAD hydrolase protein n=1 Tax=Mycoplasmopsis californica HAZ160_1 TaxID=1397850 RepID=A0AAT9F8R5_9BACT|nr:HAD-IIB family hydrolase [Mycoplasmopsis californica]BAP01293.1 hypothetical protein MCAL160_0961 [Mycoplasmopsis californica HAZ160_1]BBG41167.1 hypothetical protein MCAL106_0961 [Mycoplasmopsis californica]BBG41760.1 hypothetical protein MCAL106E_0961 [Mycoplasmopsis californica]BBG42354.1 hypothetical protein MCAL106L_0961 [Mycoplasmopsis californica]BBG42929.1 hypothetical protein MCAL160E_0961 [Mycoplasmopsis californica]